MLPATSLPFVVMHRHLRDCVPLGKTSLCGTKGSSTSTSHLPVWRVKGTIYTHWLGLHADVCIRRNITNKRKSCPVIITGVQSFCTPCDAGVRARDRWSTHCGWGASCTTCQFSWCWSPCVWKALQSRGGALQLAARLAAQRCGWRLWRLAPRCLLWRAPCRPTHHARPADLWA